ncbi:hypothetical protein NUSPORA_00019 [Nucleospora cyclopteri]
MKIAALISGGKDSIYSLCKMIDENHKIECILHMYTKKEWADSYMYQTVGSEIIHLIQKALDIPLVLVETQCQAKNQELIYEETENDEVEDLFEAIKYSKEKYKIEGVCSGAILSNYQKNRVENICNRLGITSFTPLWQQDQELLIKEMINYGINAIIVKVASPIFTKDVIGKELKEVYSIVKNHFNKFNDYNYCGEGGEYETLVLNCKYFKNSIEIEDLEKICHPEDEKKPENEKVYYAKIRKAKLINKSHIY